MSQLFSILLVIIMLFNGANKSEISQENTDNIEDSNQDISSGQTSNDEDNGIKALTKSEVDDISEYLNDEKYGGFLWSNYDKPEDIDMTYVIYGMLDLFEPADKSDSIDARHWYDMVPTRKASKSDIDEFLLQTTGLTADKYSVFNGVYEPENDSYYNHISDYFSGGPIKIHSELSNYNSNTDEYLVVYEFTNVGWKPGELGDLYNYGNVILKKSTNDMYKFVSNALSK